MIAANVFMQQLAPDAKRGRIMSFYMLGNVGTIPIGSLIFYGGLGEWLGPTTMFFIGGIIFFIAIGLFTLKLKAIRQQACPIFMKKELLKSRDQLNKIWPLLIQQ